MENPPERKWKTLRDIASPQQESRSEVAEDEAVPTPEAEETEQIWPVEEEPGIVVRPLPEEIAAHVGRLEPEAAETEDDEAAVETPENSEVEPEEEEEIPVSVEEPPKPAAPAEPERILVAHPVSSTMRLIRETLGNFTSARVDSTSDALRAFELALQKPYRLFLFAIDLGKLDGPLLYELISTTYSTGHGAKDMAPGVVFIREKDDPKLPDELSRDARVKDVLTKPLRIERFLEAIGGSVEVRDPMGR